MIRPTACPHGPPGSRDTFEKRIRDHAVRDAVAVAAAILLLGSSASPAAGQQATGTEDVDHAGIIRSWTDENRARGQRIYDAHCYSCHGYEGEANLPDARAFNSEELRAGNDPYSMWLTLTEGFGQMVPQVQYTPEERYDVVHFIREVFIKGPNEEQYFQVTDEYLESLPEGTPREDLVPPDGHPRDYGPVLTSQFLREVNRAMTFDLGEDVFVTYDLHRMRQHHAWTGFLNLSQTQHMRYRGEGQPFPDGEPLEGLRTYHWAYGPSFDAAPENSLMQGLEDGKSMGPTAPELMRYNGHYLDGRTATLSFSVSGREVLDRPRVHRLDELVILENVLRVAPGETSLQLAVGAFEGEPGAEGILGLRGQLSSALDNSGSAHRTLVVAADGTASGGAAGIGGFIGAAVAGGTEELEWEITSEHRLGLHIPSSATPRTIRVLRFAGTGTEEWTRVRDYIELVVENGLTTAPDLSSVLSGGAARWTTVLETTGVLDVKKARYDPISYRRNEDVSPTRIKDRPRVSLPDDPAYVVDDLPLPEDNPWNAWMRMAALDFFDDGRLAVSTLGGDVWIVSGVDDTLERLRWRRFATGLFEPLGLRVIDDLVYVTTRDGILRLHDLDDDGEADYYEDFYADTDVSNGFHAFNFDLQTDSEGNLYFTKPGRYTDYSEPGALLRISPDGEDIEVLARGFRVPNGMGIDPENDRIYVSGQEGQWVPASKITIVPVDQDGMPWLGVSQTDDQPFDTFVQPVIWMPRELDSSTGGELVVRDERFGPLDGKLMHVSFGKGWAYYHMLEEVEGVTQGSVVALPFQFDAGVQRLRVNPADGQVYLVGLTGWDAEATDRDGSLNRIRYTGRPAHMLDGTHVRSDGIELVFTFDVDPESAAATANYSVERWNYRWTGDYGSDHWSVDDPNTTGHDAVPVAEAVIGDDGRSVLLRIDDLRPADQMMVRMDILADDGTPYKEVTYLTVHRVPAPQ